MSVDSTQPIRMIFNLPLPCTFIHKMYLISCVHLQTGQILSLYPEHAYYHCTFHATVTFNMAEVFQFPSHNVLIGEFSKLLRSCRMSVFNLLQHWRSEVPILFFSNCCFVKELWEYYGQMKSAMKKSWERQTYKENWLNVSEKYNLHS